MSISGYRVSILLYDSYVDPDRFHLDFKEIGQIFKNDSKLWEMAFQRDKI